MAPRNAIDTVLERLNGVKRNGKGYRARCPAHDDHHPSLDVVEGTDGRVLVNCRSRGCSFEDIARAIGLEKHEFYPSSGNGTGARWTQEDADAALTNRGLRPGTVRYFHIAANLEKQAWEFPLGQEAGVKFKRFEPNGEGPKNWVPKGTKLGVYHLKPCAGKDEAWLVEGEPDVWIARQAGLLAFTFTGGAGNVPKGAVEKVAKAGIGIVNIVYDNDDEGRDGAQKAARELQAAGVKVCIRRLPESVGDKGDVTTLYGNLGRNDAKFREALKALPEVEIQPEKATQNTHNTHNTLNSRNIGADFHSEYSEYSEMGPWVTPEPIGVGDLRPFPTTALPSWCVQFVRELACSTQTPEDLAGLLVLASMGVAVQGKYEVEPWAEYRESLSVFVVVTMPSGSRKSSVFALVTRPLFDFEQRLAEEAAPQVARRQADRAILEEQLKHARSKAAREESPEEQRSLADKAGVLAGELEKLPEMARPRLLADDVTPERLASLMAEQGGRMGLMSSEGGIFQTMAGRYSANGEVNLDVFLKGYTGDPVTLDRQDGRQYHIARPALSIGLTVQPTVLRGLVGGRNTEFRGRGLLGRFWYSLPPNLLGRRKVGPVSMKPATAENYGVHIKRLLQTDWATGPDGNQQPHTLRLSQAALVQFLAYGDDVEPRLGPGGDFSGMTDWGGKLVGAVVRLCGLLHLGDGNDTDTPIGPDVVERAVAIGGYLEAHAKAAYFEMGSDPVTGAARDVCDWILRRQDTSFSKRDVHQAHRSRFKQAKDVDPVLELLVEYGYIRPQREPAAGAGRKPSPTYEVNPEWRAQNTHNTHKGLSGDQTTPAVEAPTSDTDSSVRMSTQVQGVLPPHKVTVQAKEYAIGHPDCSRDDVIRHLGLGVPQKVTNAALDQLAESEERFAGLRKEAGRDRGEGGAVPPHAAEDDYEVEERRAIQAEAMEEGTLL